MCRYARLCVSYGKRRRDERYRTAVWRRVGQRAGSDYRGRGLCRQPCGASVPRGRLSRRRDRRSLDRAAFRDSVRRRLRRGRCGRPEPYRRRAREIRNRYGRAYGGESQRARFGREPLSLLLHQRFRERESDAGLPSPWGQALSVFLDGCGLRHFAHRSDSGVRADASHQPVRTLQTGNRMDAARCGCGPRHGMHGPPLFQRRRRGCGRPGGVFRL